MSVAKLLDQLGGIEHVAQLTGITYGAVWLWQERDRIPPSRHLSMWLLAVEHGIGWAPPGIAGLATLVPIKPVVPPYRQAA